MENILYLSVDMVQEEVTDMIRKHNNQYVMLMHLQEFCRCLQCDISFAFMFITQSVTCICFQIYYWIEKNILYLFHDTLKSKIILNLNVAIFTFLYTV